MEVSIKVEKRDTPPVIEGWGPFKKVVVPVKTVFTVFCSCLITREERAAIDTLGLRKFVVWESPKLYEPDHVAGGLKETSRFVSGQDVLSSDGHFFPVLDCPNLGSANAVEKQFAEAIKQFALRLKQSDTRETRTNTFQV